MQEGGPYAMSMRCILADKKDAENAEAAFALTYVINNWDEAVNKGSKILSEKMKKLEEEKN